MKRLFHRSSSILLSAIFVLLTSQQARTYNLANAKGMRGVSVEDALNFFQDIVSTPVISRVQRRQRQIEPRIIREQIKVDNDYYDDATVSDFDIFLGKLILAIIFVPVILYIFAYSIFIVVVLLVGIIGGSMTALIDFLASGCVLRRKPSHIRRHKSKNK